MNCRIFAVSLCGLFLASNAAIASSYTAYVGGWNQHYSGDLIDQDGTKDVESELRIEKSGNLEAGIIWFGQDGWIPNVRLTIFQIQASGFNTLSESESLDLLGIPIVTATGSADVATDIDYLIWSSNFFYGLEWNGFDFELGATLNFVDGVIEADVDYDAVAEGSGRVDERRRNATQSVIPTGYAGASRKLNEWISLHMHLYAASTGTDSVGQYSIALEADWDYDISLIAGYRAQTVDFFDEDNNTGLDVTIAGLFGGVSYQF